MSEYKLYDPKSQKHIATYKFIKSKSKYFVKFQPNYLHDNVWTENIEEYKKNKGLLTGYELGTPREHRDEL